jgi:NADPH:quinone reductase-like Zn-dependent oxidoreductase
MAKRIRIHKAGGWDKLKIEQFNSPDPKSDELKIVVKAAGINFADTVVRQGLYASAKKYKGWPITPGFEVSGVVSEVGADVNDFKVGDKVMSITRFKGYSSELVVKSIHARLIPGDLDFYQAASIPAVFGTSYYAVHRLSHPRKGSICLVHSAAGGVGLALIQMLKNLDCKVIGVVGSPSKIEIASKYGADIVIDKSTQSLWKEVEKHVPKGLNIIFEPNGFSTLKQSYNHLKETGSLVIYGHQSMLSKTKGKQNPFILMYGYLRTPRYNPFKLIKDNKSILAFNVSFLFDDEELIGDCFDYLIENINNGLIRPLPIKTYSFDNVVKAHQDIQSGKTIGKLVLKF